MSTSLLLLAAAFVLILANGFFVAAEFGLVTVERPAAERAVTGPDLEDLAERRFDQAAIGSGATISADLADKDIESAQAGIGRRVRCRPDAYESTR